MKKSAVITLTKKSAAVNVDVENYCFHWWTSFYGFLFEASNFGEVMKNQKPSNWVKVDRFQGLLHLRILRIMNFEEY